MADVEDAEELVVERGKRCDFCSSKHVAWRFPCETFGRNEEAALDDGAIGLIFHRYAGDWAACSRCMAAWQEGGMDGLIARVVRRYVTVLKDLADPTNRGRLEKTCRRLYAQFEMHRNGDPVPYQRDGGSD